MESKDKRGAQDFPSRCWVSDYISGLIRGPQQKIFGRGFNMIVAQ